MAEKMVRTQVYLPQAVYAQLRKRATKHGLTLAVQIREALESYLRRTNGVGGDEIEPLDLGNLFEIIG
ncbi:MAG: CopG family transcriptional regulator, partial [Chloroflexota bacterium]